jgi:hypothetical protein
MKKTDGEELIKVRVSTMLFQAEKIYLQFLAMKSGRSMASYLRFLLLEAIDEDD